MRTPRNMLDDLTTGLEVAGLLFFVVGVAFAAMIGIGRPYGVAAGCVLIGAQLIGAAYLLTWRARPRKPKIPKGGGEQ